MVNNAVMAFDGNSIFADFSGDVAVDESVCVCVCLCVWNVLKVSVVLKEKLFKLC